MKHFTSLLAAACFTLTSCSSLQKKPAPNQIDAPPPKLLAPSVRKIWIPAQLKDGGQEWEAGHYLYRIDRNTSWSR